MLFFLRFLPSQPAPRSLGERPSSALYPTRASGLLSSLSNISDTWLLLRCGLPALLGLSLLLSPAGPVAAQTYNPNGTTVAGGNEKGVGANQLSYPTGVYVDGSGNVYVADSYNDRIQKWAPGASSGTTVAGGNGAGDGANQLDTPAGVFVDGSGNVYVSDAFNHRIQKWAPGASSGTTVAGGNGQGAGANQLYTPFGIFVDGLGNIYVADRDNDRIQKWAPGASSGTTVAGGNGRGNGADQLYRPEGVFVDGSGNVYVADWVNQRIQKWAPGASSGTTVAGGNGAGAGANQLSLPTGVYVDGSGNVYVADRSNDRIQKWAPGASSGTTVAGGNGQGAGANQLNLPTGVYVDGSGNVYVADFGNDRIQKFSLLVVPTLTGLSASPNPVCAGQPIQFAATVGNTTGNYNYALTNGAGSTKTGSASGASFSQSLTAVGSGSQTYTLTITTDGGPTDATVQVTVNPLPTPVITGLTSSYCKNATAVTLTGTPSGGSFIIDNQSATQLDPASLRVGNHTLRYTVTQNGCTAYTEQSVEIKALPNASFSGLAGPYCADAAAITLTPTLAGGTFSGPGISGTTFTPSQAGSGGTITYTVTVDGCTNTSQQNVTVKPLPNASFSGLAGPYCADAAAVTLSPTVAGGTFSGPGVSGTTFTPASAGSGGTITYTVTVDGCTSTSQQNVTVKPLPNASFTGLAGPYCADAAAVTLTPTVAGGTFSGPGVSGTTFTPSQAGSGGTITYTVTVDGCTNTSQQNVTVRPAITLNTSPNTTVVYGYGSNCTTLSASASGGTGNISLSWSNGASGPSTQVCPTQTTAYSVTATDAAGCSVTKIITVTVKDVRCGSGGVKMCQGGREVCVAQYLVPTYLRFGYTLGGCSSTARINYEQAQEVPFGLTLTAYPNPVQDAVTVQANSPVAGAATFEVLDVQGRARQSRTEQLTEGMNEVELRLGALPTGVYLIRCVNAQGKQATLRVNKQ